MSLIENKEDIGATEFYLPNSQNPDPHSPMYYGDQYVPRPTNRMAKITPHERVMRAVIEGR